MLKFLLYMGYIISSSSIPSIYYIKTALAKQVYFTAFYFFLLIFTAVQPMLWGMVPFWHRGDVPTSHKLTTNNARLEGKKIAAQS